jgi:chemotaxis protein methyltransferase CheR
VSVALVGDRLAGDEYVAFCEGLRALCQVDLLQYRRRQMERRIRAFVARRGVRRLSEYLALLRSREEELEAFLDHVTINVSGLWRNPEQWELLAREVLPELAQAGRIRAWSAGCSYGAEPYTLAALCLDVAPRARLSVLATDIDARMIARAVTGRFSAEDARHAPERLLRRFFLPDGEGWLAGDEIRRVVSFQTGDLLRQRVPSARYDLILCRYTVIYFTDAARDDLHARLAQALRPGGYLMVGCTERVARPAACGLAPAHPFIYRKS